jgi:16S rRNA (cytosine1402-N4)-methyltransferase
MLHFPVLLEESIDFLIHDIDGHYLDCTYGRGGHSKLILEMISNNGFLSAFDKDPDSISFASNIKVPNFKIYHDSFKNLEQHIERQTIDGIIYDLGTCSTHFDDPKRGFSFNKDGPLDMRFNNTKGIPLSDWINTANEENIVEVLFKLGDERHARLIANEICKQRKYNPILRTTELARIIEQIYPNKKQKIHPATKSFQAFRIFLNSELEDLKLSLEAAKKVIKKKGVIVTIAFHSLEDNIIKNSFKPSLKSFPKDIPVNNIEEKDFTCIAKKIRPSEKEIKMNNRSRSAIMRVFQKI